MTENTNTETLPEADARALTAENPQRPEEPEKPEESGNREAAKYRRQLRDAEAERDQLRTDLTVAREQILRHAVEQAKVGRASFNMDAYDDAALTVAEFFENGTLDSEKLAAHLNGLHESKPYLFTEPRLGNMAPREGSTVRDTGSRASAQWQAAFMPETA